MKAEKAYGCYGYVTTYHEQSQTCQVCPLHKSCRVAAYKALKAMSAEIDVTGLVARFGALAENDNDPIHKGYKAPKSRRQKLKQYTQSKNAALLVMHLPNKERKLITGIHKKGIPVRQMVRAGANPFEGHRPAFMRVPCRILIETGRFTRRELKQALMVEFPHWSENTAESHASISLGVLTALKVIQKIDDVYFRMD